MTSRLAARLVPAAVLILGITIPLSAALTTANLRKPAPAFTLEDAHGTPVKLADYKGKVVLLNFWATWCHGCQTEIPWFVDFQKSYQGKGLSVVGVSMDDDGWKSVKPYLEKKKLNYPIVIGSKGLANSYGLETMPLTVLIDRDGRIAVSYSGVVDRATCERDLLALLDAPPK